MTNLDLMLRLKLPKGAVFGPGKAELLACIEAEGSISAAGRQTGMSSKRAWSLVEEMNASFVAPLVESSRGGASGGGARVTETGLRVLTLYRAVVAQTLESDQVAEIAALLVDMSNGK
jgi:molybdate transport system regulatory protein